MQQAPTNTDPLTGQVIKCAIAVHRALGPGLLESTYEAALCYELSAAGLSFERQISLPVAYRKVKLDCGYRVDILVEQQVVVELKCVDRILPLHEAQLLTYLRHSGCRKGLILNFFVQVMKNGIKRMVI